MTRRVRPLISWTLSSTDSCGHCFEKSSITSLTVAGFDARAKSGKEATAVRFAYGTTIMLNPKKKKYAQKGKKKFPFFHTKGYVNQRKKDTSQG